MKYLTILLLLFASCRTNKSIQKFAKEVDSTGFFTGDTTRIIKSDSTGKKSLDRVKETEVNNDYEKVTVIEEYDHPYPMIGEPDSSTKIIPIEASGQTFEYKIGFRRTTIYEKDHGKVKTTVTTSKTDTASESKTDTSKGEYEAKVNVVKSELTLDKQVKRSGIPWWLWAVSGLAIFAILYLKRKWMIDKIKSVL